MICCVIGCNKPGLHRIYELPGREYCTSCYQITARKIAILRRVQRKIALANMAAIERRNESEDNSPARIQAEM